MTVLNWSQFRATRKQRTRPLIVAHRGSPTVQPENTLPSFQLALTQGADALETDLRFTRDDQIVLLHDSTLDRTTNGQGAVQNYTLAELKRYKTRLPGGQFSDVPIITLAELIEATNAQMPLLLELKDARFMARRDALRLIELLDRYDMVQRTAVISFHHEYVTSVEAAQPVIPTGTITLWNPLPMGKSELMGPVWPLLYANPFYVWWAHRLDKVICPLDPKPEPRIRYYLRLGVDALLTDNPALTLDAIAQAQR